MKRSLLLFVILCSMPLVAQRAIPEDNLAAPVLINLSDCNGNIVQIKGSGVFLQADGNVYLVTARHVLFNESERIVANQPRQPQCNKAELISYSKNPKDKSQNRIMLDLRVMNQAGLVKAHVTHDVAVVRWAQLLEKIATPLPAGPPPEPATNAHLSLLAGVLPSTFAPSGVMGVDFSTVTKLDMVLIGNEIYTLGYPSSIGIQQSPQIDYNSPLIRRGSVAGINDNTKTIVLDCLIFHGNSGGPVFQINSLGLSTEYHLIGIVSQYVPVAETWLNTSQGYANMQIYNSGYSIAEPMDAVLELIGK